MIIFMVRTPYKEDLFCYCLVIHIIREEGIVKSSEWKKLKEKEKCLAKHGSSFPI